MKRVRKPASPQSLVTRVWVGADRAGLGQAKGQDGPPLGQVAPQVGPGGIPGDHEGTVGREAAGDLALGPGHTLDAAEPLQVGATGIGQQGRLGAGDVGQVADLARVIGPKLQDQPVLVPGAEQGQGHPDVVVEVALGRHDAPDLAQDGGDHLLAGGLAVAAGDGQDPAWDAPTPGSGQAPEAEAGVVHHPLGQIQVQGALHQGRDSPIGSGLGDEGVCVEALPAQRHEQAPGAVAPAVGDDPGEAAVGAGQAPACFACGLAQVPHQRRPPVHSRRACTTWARSLKRTLSSPKSWVVSWPLPATSTVSAVPARARARRMARPRLRST